MPRPRPPGCAAWRIWAAACPVREPRDGPRPGQSAAHRRGLPRPCGHRPRHVGAPQSDQSTPRPERSRGITHLSRSVALATCSEVPEGDEDAPALEDALRARGVEAAAAVWNAPAVDWDAFDLVVLRSTWDYAEHYDEFLAWSGGLPRLANPAPVVRWSTDKRYLAELAAAGVPVTPTQYLEPGERLEPRSGRFVVKPVVSAGGRRSAAYAPERATDAVAHVGALHAEGRTAMVQPYLEGIDAEGETGLVWLGGSYSHAFRKGPLLTEGAQPGTGLYLEEAIERRRASAAERSVGDAALAALPFAASGLLYARVDVAPGPDGRPLVLEVELAEPSLYLWCDDGAAERFAGAIAAELHRGLGSARRR